MNPNEARPPPHPELPSQRFHGLLNSFFKVLFTFPLTVLGPLSVLHLYSALDGVYHPLGAAISNNPTPRVRTLVPPLPVSLPYGALTLSGTPFQVDFGPEQWSSGPGQFDSPDHNSPVNTQSLTGDFRPGPSSHFVRHY